MIWLKTWWPGLLVLFLGLAILGYGAWKEHEGKEDAKKDAKVEKLERQNNALNESVNIRRKQNEVLVLDITPSDFNDILLNGQF